MTERKHYTREFKFEALELWRTSGKPAAHIERDLGIHKGQLHAWKRQFEKQGTDAFPGHGYLPEPEAELRRLQRENAVLRQERDILRKAIAIFSEPKAP